MFGNNILGYLSKSCFEILCFIVHIRAIMYEFVYIVICTFDSEFKKHQKESILVENFGHNRIEFGR